MNVFFSIINCLILTINIFLLFKEDKVVQKSEFYSGVDLNGRYLAETKYIGMNVDSNKHSLLVNVYVSIPKILDVEGSEKDFVDLKRWYVVSTEACEHHGYHMHFFDENSINIVFSATIDVVFDLEL